MPHQCTTCGHVFADGSKEMLAGCPDCGGNTFQFHPKGADIPTEPPAGADADAPPSAEGTGVANTVGRATTRVRDFVSSGSSKPTSRSAPDSASSDPTPLNPATPDPTTSDPTTSDPSVPDPAATWPDDSHTTGGDPSTTGGDGGDSTDTPAESPSDATIIDADFQRDTDAQRDADTAADADAQRDPDAQRGASDAADDGPEDTAQANARRDLATAADVEAGTANVGADTADIEADMTDVEADTAGDGADVTDDATARGDGLLDERAGPPGGSGGRVVSEPTGEQPSLGELREQLNEQFESIKIVEPGQYELNLMELYDREEYIIALQENGRYVIQVPENWLGDRDVE